MPSLHLNRCVFFTNACNQIISFESFCKVSKDSNMYFKSPDHSTNTYIQLHTVCCECQMLMALM